MASVSVFDIFTIGIGPSSSHTVGPMKAAKSFVAELEVFASEVASVVVSVHGSLAWTGKGHGTDGAILLGLSGYAPETLDPDSTDDILRAIHADKVLAIPVVGELAFDPETQLLFDFKEELPRHTNGMRFTACSASGDVILEVLYYSLGGGFIARNDDPEAESQTGTPPFPFNSGDSLLQQAADNGLSIAELMYRNETSRRSSAAVDERLTALWRAMQSCVQRGMRTEGVLPGKMAVLRRAARLSKALSGRGTPSPLDAMEWVNVFAIAVNEENAVGGRVVTSPTNGAAGIIPAVMMYYDQFEPNASLDGIHKFLLTAGAIGVLYKLNASISGAEMGCQGEIGVACSMAAAGLAAVLGGSNDHIEEAAEIGMEHNLGLTCDPIGGLVQIPCIERNAMGAVKAINAAKLAMHGDGSHKVSLDQVIETMRQTGLDMSTHYKETSQGGLAVNVPEC
jgi:L-serine dehydratase